MPIVLDREQRSAIRAGLLPEFDPAGDIGAALARGEWRIARRYRRHLEDAARLMDDVGWSDDDPAGRPVIWMDPHALGRTLTRVREYVVSELRHSDPSSDPAARKQWTLAAEVCDDALSELASCIKPDATLVADFIKVMKEHCEIAGYPAFDQEWDYFARTILERLLPMLDISQDCPRRSR